MTLYQRSQSEGRVSKWLKFNLDRTPGLPGKRGLVVTANRQPQVVAQQADTQPRRERAAPQHGLTESQWLQIKVALDISMKQMEVIRWQLCDLSVDKIAHAMGIEVCTVETYHQRTYKDLGVHSYLGLSGRLMVEIMKVVNAAPSDGSVQCGISGGGA